SCFVQHGEERCVDRPMHLRPQAALAHEGGEQPYGLRRLNPEFVFGDHGRSRVGPGDARSAPRLLYRAQTGREKEVTMAASTAVDLALRGTARELDEPLV